MEPLRGGALAGNLPPAVQALWDSALTLPSPAAAGEGKRAPPPTGPSNGCDCGQPEVSRVLSGMSTFEQVEQNVASADRSGVGAMAEEELAPVAQAREACPAPTAWACLALLGTNDGPRRAGGPSATKAGCSATRTGRGCCTALPSSAAKGGSTRRPGGMRASSAVSEANACGV